MKDNFFPTLRARIEYHFETSDELVSGLQGIAYDHPELASDLEAKISELNDILSAIRTLADSHDADVADQDQSAARAQLEQEER